VERIATIPGSKSLTNRALLAAAAADGVSILRHPLVSDDTTAFASGLRSLGYAVDGDGRGQWTVRGTGRGPTRPGATIDCADAGTAARFLPALAATGRGTYRFDGSEQLRRRPLGPLLDGLRALGAAITNDSTAGQDLPFSLTASGLAGGEVDVDARTSSQYLSGLLLAAPLMRRPLVLSVAALVSRPYIAMTLQVMARFGVAVETTVNALTGDGGSLTVARARYRPVELEIEPDASTASYFFAAAALTGTTITVPALGTESSQGDLRFVSILERMGATVAQTAGSTTVTGTRRLRGGISVDMGDISDTFMTLAAIAPFAEGPVHVSGIGHARLKETDRIEAMAANLRRCGIAVEDGADWIRIHPGQPSGAVIACHRDHRIAMAFSVLALRATGVRLDDPGCVSKTFPGFHEEFSRHFR
jgi:3-phosphoshikimate 1-carboxyvinyltransferase